MPHVKVPERVYDDLNRFVSAYYSNNLPNSLIVAQAFILKHHDYGKEFGLFAINDAIEDGIKQGLF
jgi:hypothetical protein